MTTYYNPVKIILGDFDQAIAAIQENLGQTEHALLVTTPGMEARGEIATFCAKLPKTQFYIQKIASQPDLDDLDSQINQLLAENITPSWVIAYGGGSVMDAAKVYALALTHRLNSPLDRWLRQKEARTKAPLPLICLPSTAGTGSEVTPFATIWDHKLMCKHSLAGNDLFPKIAIECPQLTYSLPPKLTLYGALDALSHVLEIHWNQTTTFMSGIHARSAFRMLSNTFPALFETTTQNRCALQLAAMLAGLAISQSHTSLAHAMSYPLSLHFGVPHGLACSAFLPFIVKLVIKEKAWSIEPPREALFLLGHIFETLQLNQDVYNYCSQKDIEQCVPEMLQNSRANTFTLKIDQDTLLKIVQDFETTRYFNFLV